MNFYFDGFSDETVHVAGFGGDEFGVFSPFFTFYDTSFYERSRYSDWLRAGRSGDRIPVGGGRARFSAPVQTGPGTHPASYTMDTGSFKGVNRPGRDVDPSTPSNAVGHERVELYLYSPYGPSWPVPG